MTQVALDPLSPALPRQTLTLAGACRGVVLGIPPVELEMAQLGVGDQGAVDEEPGSDAGPERENEDDPLAFASRAETHLGQARGIGVVDDVHVASGCLGEERVGVGANPRRIDVGGAA